MERGNCVKRASLEEIIANKLSANQSEFGTISTKKTAKELTELLVDLRVVQIQEDALPLQAVNK